MKPRHPASPAPAESPPAAGPPLTFAEAADAWLVHGERKRKLTRSTLADYRRTLDTYLLPVAPALPRPDPAYGRAPFAGKPVGEIRSADLERWHDGLPPGRTADKLVTIVAAVLAHARSCRSIDTGGGGGSVTSPAAAAEPGFYSREEIAGVVRAAANEQDAAIFTCAALAGLRRRELVELRWRDIDFAGRTIRVASSFTHGELVRRKAGKVTSVPIVDEVVDALSRVRARAAFTADHDPVFTDAVGGQLEASAIRRRYARAAQRAGLRPLPFPALSGHLGAPAVNP